MKRKLLVFACVLLIFSPSCRDDRDGYRETELDTLYLDEPVRIYGKNFQGEKVYYEFKAGEAFNLGWTMPSDVNQDGKVNTLDLIQVRKNLGAEVVDPQTHEYKPAPQAKE